MLSHSRAPQTMQQYSDQYPDYLYIIVVFQSVNTLFEFKKK